LKHKIADYTKLYFVTFTVINWIDIRVASIILMDRRVERDVGWSGQLKIKQ